MSITLTSSAKSQLRQSVADREKGIGVRVGVKRTGCSGLAYLMEYVDALADEDEVYQFDDVKLVIDKKSLIYLKGTELDYVKNGLNEGFEFKTLMLKMNVGVERVFTSEPRRSDFGTTLWMQTLIFLRCSGSRCVGRLI